MSNLIEFVDGDMTEEDRKKIDELLIKIAEENELPGKIGKLEAENKRLREALQMIATEKDNHGQWLSVEQAAQIAKDTLQECGL